MKNGFKKFVLENGLTVLYKRNRNKTFFCKLRVKFGTLNEKKGEEGLAHFLEHLIVSSGSKLHSSEESEKVWSRLGVANRTTALNQTYFHADSFSEDLEEFLDLLRSSVFEPRFEDKIVKRERKAVLREIGEYRNNNSANDHELFWEKFSGGKNAFTRGPLGLKSVINSVSKRKLISFYKRGYAPNNMILILIGGLPGNIEDIVKEKFSKYKKGEVKEQKFPKVKPIRKREIFHMSAPDLLVSNSKESSNVQILLAFQVPSWLNRESPNLSILASVLGAGSDSKLFTEIRHKRGLAYSVGANYDGSYGAGVLTIRVAVSIEKREEAVLAIFDVLKDLQENLISEEHFENVKRRYIYFFLKSNESIGGQANAAEEKEVSGFEYEKSLKLMKKVSREDIREAARKYLAKDIDDNNYMMLLRDPSKEEVVLN